MHRIIQRLATAREDAGPKAFTAKRRRPRGAKGAGVKFERELSVKLLAAACHGQWFKFWDANGPGFAQTDFLLFCPDYVVCLEAKLGNISGGRDQFLQLYKPILEMVYGRPVYGLVVARHITELPSGMACGGTLTETLLHAIQSRDVACLHWRERYPLGIPPWLGPHPTPAAPRLRVSS